MRVHHRPFQFHDYPDLFEWLAVRDQRITNLAVRRIAQRYGLSMSAAAVIARLAGLGVSESAR
jgi:hypothetical protein